MGLFSKKPPCPICGEKISWFLPSKVEGEYVCDGCYGKLDMQEDLKNSLTMQGFRQYLADWQQNQLLQQQFVVSQRVDFGLLDTKMIFDYENNLFCFSKTPNKTIFTGNQLRSFVIKEDHAPLFEGSAQGLRRYTSTVPDRTMALTPLISQFILNQRLADNARRNDDNDQATFTHVFDLPEPFRNFNVELQLEHPYWNLYRCDRSGPTFSNTHPDVDSYMREYHKGVEEMETLARALMRVAFPGTPEITMGSGVAAASAAPVFPSGDPIDEIRKYKSLLEEGLLSEEEFQAKKRQLMGI